MKKVLLLFFLFLIIPSNVQAYSAEAMVAMDINSGRVLFESNANKEKLIASTTKIMTTIIAIENKNLDDEIIVDERVLKAYGSAIYIEIGEVISLRDLLYGLMLRSGNDAALVIANGVAESVEAFVTLMNEKAYQLGMSHTRFLNPHGLEENNGEGNTSTAYDMALLMRYAMQNDTFKEITKTLEYVGKSDKKTYHWENKNKLLRTYEYAIGGKTGFTEKARRTLVTAAAKDDMEVAVVTLNDGNDFHDHQSCYETLFSNYQSVTVLKKDDFTVPDFNFYQDDTLYIEKDMKMMVTSDEVEKVHVNYEMNRLKEYKSGDIVGVAHIMIDNKEITSTRVYVKRKEVVEKVGFFKRFFGWLFSW